MASAPNSSISSHSHPVHPSSFIIFDVAMHSMGSVVASGHSLTQTPYSIKLIAISLIAAGSGGFADIVLNSSVEGAVTK